MKYGKRIIEKYPKSETIFFLVLVGASFLAMPNEINVRFIKELTTISITVLSILAAILIAALTLILTTSASISQVVKRKARLATLVICSSLMWSFTFFYASLCLIESKTAVQESGYYRFIGILAIAAFLISFIKVFAALFAIIDEFLLDKEDDSTFY
ncbi:hypothetical protein [Anaerospora hongkongensis]|uniref:hypothetical protein n=1 Tax=Anaerospora hongkongensis TaxID=244830 RepID=UPI0028A2807A|nr:hypothetical protein [Anaerospora hongkongensis]